MTTNAKDDDDDDESIPTTVAAAVAADTSEQVVVLHPATTTTTTTTPSISYENTTRKTCESSSSPSLVANHTNNENHTQTNTISTTATTPILPLPTTTTNTAVVDVALAKAEKRAWEFEQEQNRSKVVATEDAVTLIDKATEDAVALAAMQEAATIVMEAEQNLKKRKAATNTESSLSSSPNHKKQRSPPTKQRSPPTRVPWEDRLLQLQDYKTQHGNLLIPIRYKLNPSLGKFVHNTREQYKLFHKQTPEGYKKKCSLTAERIQQLDDMGFAWTTQRKHKQTLDWQSRLQQLQAFKEKCGHCLVPHGYTPDPSFAEWIHRQRTTYATMLKDSKPNPVVKERMEQLEAMGFNFTVHSDKWTDHWNQLKEYKDKHGVSTVL